MLRNRGTFPGRLAEPRPPLPQRQLRAQVNNAHILLCHMYYKFAQWAFMHPVPYLTCVYTAREVEITCDYLTFFYGDAK